MTNGGKVVVCEKTLDDAANDYAWQTDPELTHLTATHPLSIAFPDYLSKYKCQLRYNRPGKYSFSIKTQDGKHIGNCTCYNIDESLGETEIGIIIGDRNYWDKGYGADAVKSLVDHVFSNIRIIRIYLKTLASNKRAQKCFAKCGFSACGQIVIGGNSYILMELHRNNCRQNTVNGNNP